MNLHLISIFDRSIDHSPRLNCRHTSSLIDQQCSIHSLSRSLLHSLTPNNNKQCIELNCPPPSKQSRTDNSKSYSTVPCSAVRGAVGRYLRPKQASKQAATCSVLSPAQLASSTISSQSVTHIYAAIKAKQSKATQIKYPMQIQSNPMQFQSKSKSKSNPFLLYCSALH